MKELEAFYKNVLPSDGPWVIAMKRSAGGMAHRVYTSFASMAKAASAHPELGGDSYVCIGSIADPDFKKEGKKSPRNQENIRELRSLVLDVEVAVGTDKKYASKEAALQGLFRFQTGLGLPDPTVVDSGNGFHVWWPFMHAVSPVEWLRAARALRAAAGALEPLLIADPTRVCDSAGLLRSPGTLNFKSDPAKEVKLLSLATEHRPYEAYLEALNAYLEANNVPLPREKKTKEAVPAKAAFSSNALSLYVDEPHSFAAVLKKCAWSRAYMREKASEPEPNWYAMLGMAPYLRGFNRPPEAVAQLMSEGHPGYTPERAERKFRQAEKNQTGPTLCEKFASLAPARCAGCPYRAMVNTPVRLDLVDLPAEAPVVTVEVIRESGETETETVALPAPPKPYFRGKEGGIYMATTDGEDGEVRRIYEYDIFPVRRLKDEETDNEMVEISLTLPQDGHRFIKVSNGLLTDPKKFTAELANKGVLVHTREAPTLTAYIIEYARLIQREEKAHEEFARFGWRDVDSENPRFVLGDFVADTKGDLRRATPAPYLKAVRDVISVRGNLEGWKEGFNVYKGLNSEPLKFALMMGFAAPLLALTPFNGLIYNMLGDSGSGKSTALKLMTSIWGKPNEHHIQVHDNRIPMFNTIGYLQSIPIAFDELTTIPSDTLADIAYSISEGRGKNRADRSGNTRANTVYWKTIVCGSSNSSLYEKLGMSRSGNNAHAYRIFEVLVAPAHVENRPAIDAALARVEANYGLAGRIYILDILKNLPEVRKIIEETTVRFAKEFNMPTAERFWFTLFSCMAVGGWRAKRLGLHDYDVEEIILWTTKQLAHARETVGTVEGDAFSTLSHFMSMNLRNTLQVKDGKPDLLGIDGVSNSLMVRLEFEGTEARYGFASVEALKGFCKSQFIEYGWMLKRLEDAKLVVAVENKRLGEGTPMLTGATRCWKIDLQHASMRANAPAP